MAQNGLNIDSVAAGARIVVRDAEWLVKRVDTTSSGGQALSCVGLSELVREKEATFLTEVEDEVAILRPEETRLVPDHSRGYQDSLVYLEGLLRQSPPTDDKLYIGHRGAMDTVPYQMDPAIQSLNQPRQRILIADAVGLGKTIECGILLSELIKRGRGKRILVLAMKSMLTQFQKELWARFTIPLVRLDSIGIQRIRSKIPSNHNPFYFYDKAIISIDTLKQEAEYRTYVEDSYWDIIVIDEAQNVAERRTNSMRSKLARMISSRSDTLIMLSATPHDGKKRSFASLMNMLNPTAITNLDDYGPEDIRGLFIRRFKKDIKDQVASSFKERTIKRSRVPAAQKEEEAFDFLTEIEFKRLDKRRGGSMLFKTTLEKALFSSPAACIETIRNRIHTLKKNEDPEYATDIEQLRILKEMLSEIGPSDFSKYQKLCKDVKQSDWDWNETNDRLVIFTERIETLRFLYKHLPSDIGLNEKQVATLYGSMSDIEQQEIVERFGKENDSVRLLIASDVASEGINLHYLCHRMIHFDIPWSLIVFQQRNGRIDRYGQQATPEIRYLVTESDNPRINGDMRILELLTEKDEQVVENIGDPSEFTGIYDQEEEEIDTAEAMEEGMSTKEFEDKLENQEVDPLSILMGDMNTPAGQYSEDATDTMPSLFESDFDYFVNGLKFIQRQQGIHYEVDEQDGFVTLNATGELEQRLRYLPPEIEIKDDQIHFSADRERIQREIADCRKEERRWPNLHLLWEQHPVMQWVNDKAVAAFRRHEAPVLTLRNTLKPNESIFLVSGVIPNRKSHPLIHRWLGMRFIDSHFEEKLDMDEVMRITGIGQSKLANPRDDNDLGQLSRMLPFVVEQSREAMTRAREEWEYKNRPTLEKHQQRLQELRGRRYQQLEIVFQGELSTLQQNKREREKRHIDRIFDDYQEWIEETMTTEDKPYIRIAAVIWGGSA